MDSCPVNMVARTTQIGSALEVNPEGHGCQKYHARTSKITFLCVRVHPPAAKCVHIPCSLNNQNGLILQLLQIPMVCFGALYIDWSMPLLAD
jgi:hypothetical protein